MENFLITYHGAKNLMKAAFPAVSSSQFSGVRLGTAAEVRVKSDRVR